MNISEIAFKFKNCKNENRPALLTYIVAGDNSKKKTLEILKSISQYIDICEIGFPHNTPIADGGQIQTSAYRSIKNGFKIKFIGKRSIKIYDSEIAITFNNFDSVFYIILLREKRQHRRK